MTLIPRTPPRPVRGVLFRPMRSFLSWPALHSYALCHLSPEMTVKPALPTCHAGSPSSPPPRLFPGLRRLRPTHCLPRCRPRHGLPGEGAAQRAEGHLWPKGVGPAKSGGRGWNDMATSIQPASSWWPFCSLASVDWVPEANADAGVRPLPCILYDVVGILSSIFYPAWSCLQVQFHFHFIPCCFR